jgi:MFS family permease
MGGRPSMNLMELSKRLDTVKWLPRHWYLFGAVSLNYFLDGIVFAIAPLIAVMVAPELAVAIFATNLVAEALGSIALGYLGDRWGRKTTLILINTLQVASTIPLLFLYTNGLAVWVLTSVLSFSVGGDFGASYAALAELIPARHRGKSILLSTNFWNVGSAAIAGAALTYAAIYSDPLLQTQYILLTALATLALVVFLRLSVPESPRWLYHRGRVEEAEKIISEIAKTPFISAKERGHSRPAAPRRPGGPLFRFLILSIVTISQYVTYAMMAYYAPYAPGFTFGAESAPLVILVANAGASVGAPLLWLLIDKSRKTPLLIAFLMGTVFSGLVLTGHDLDFPGLFYTSLFICLVFSEWAWGLISSLQSELFPTGIRSTAVGVLTGLTGFAGAVVVLSQGMLDAAGFLTVSILLWAAGLAATMAWYIRGPETANRPVDEIEEELKAQRM